MAQEKDNSGQVLSGASPIQVKFIGWLVIVCASGFGGWMWWAASMSTKLDLVILNQATQFTAVKAISEDISRLKEWRIQIDSVGSPSMVRRMDDLKNEVEAISRSYELHKVTTKP